MNVTGVAASVAVTKGTPGHTCTGESHSGVAEQPGIIYFFLCTLYYPLFSLLRFLSDRYLLWFQMSVKLFLSFRNIFHFFSSFPASFLNQLS